VLFQEVVVAQIKESLRVFDQDAVCFPAGQPRTWRSAFDGIVAALVVEVSMGGDSKSESLGFDLDGVHVREDDLFRGFGDARVDKDGIVADQQILKKVAAAEEGLDLIST